MRTQTRTTTFAVDPVDANPELLPTEKAKASVQKLLGTPVEACDGYTADVVRQPGFHTLLAAADLAYRLHFPLVLSPDAVWLTIAQGLAAHVNNNAEALRSRFVSHDGKAAIKVRRHDFVRGSAENPWAEVFPAFCEKLREYVGEETHRLIVCDFSTTGPTEKAASEIVLMDSMQSYFSLDFQTLCGVPAVTLEGSVEDWEKVHGRVGRLGRYGLEWWTDQVREITAEFVHAARGEPNATFWRNLYKESGGSGGPYLSGWLPRLLPYLKTPGGGAAARNRLLEKPLDQPVGPHRGLTYAELPASTSLVPFVWEYRGTNFDYQFVAGVLTVTQDADTRAVRPRIGWAVRPTPTKETAGPALADPEARLREWLATRRPPRRGA